VTADFVQAHCQDSSFCLLFVTATDCWHWLSFVHYGTSCHSAELRKHT